MAIIYSYPTKPTPALTDLVLITDSESTNPKNQTKNLINYKIKEIKMYLKEKKLEIKKTQLVK